MTPRTYVLVHGAGSGGWVWGRMLPHMAGHGHRIYTPTLTGDGERRHLLRPDTDLEMHIADILAVLTWEDLTDVILVGHSYGGMVISGVADRAPERIAQIVFMDASRPRNGQSLADSAPAAIEASRPELRVENGVEVIGGPDSPRVRGNTSADPELRAWRLPRMSPFPWKAMHQKLQLNDEAALDRIPRTIINCTATMRSRTPESAARMRDAARVWEIDTTHDLMVTKPEEVAQMLLRLASV